MHEYLPSAGPDQKAVSAMTYDEANDFLAAFNNDGGPTELAPWFAGRRAPGSAASGLTAGGIAAAIRDYTKVHPFIMLATNFINFAATISLTEILTLHPTFF